MSFSDTKPYSVDFPAGITNSAGGLLLKAWTVHHAQTSALAIATYYTEASIYTGGLVRLLPEYQFVPVLVGSDGEPVLLYRIVESVEAAMDIRVLKNEYPTLSYSQLAAGVAYLRRIVQFNVAGLDLDDVESELEESSLEFQTQLTQALEDQERTRVLSTQQGGG